MKRPLIAIAPIAMFALAGCGENVPDTLITDGEGAELLLQLKE